MNTQKTFQIHGPVIPSENYFVERREAIAEFISRIERGRYIVIFAPRQTGKTSFFRQAIDKLSEDDSYIPISLNFEVYADVTSEMFYQDVQMFLSMQLISRLKDISQRNFSEIETFIKDYVIENHLSYGIFFMELSERLPDKKIVIIIDEFDGIPKTELRNFLHILRRTYHGVGKKAIHSIGVQYTSEVGQAFDNEVIQLIYEKTSGQPFLVNRLSQILTEEMGVPKSETITTEHFQEALHLLLKEDNTHFDTLVKNIRQHEEFKDILLKIIGREEGVPFNRRYDIHKELTTYGVIKEREGMCIIENPIYQSIIIDAFKLKRKRYGRPIFAGGCGF